MLLPDPEQNLAFNTRRRERVLEVITPREMEYLCLVCDPAEHTNKVIAGMMRVCVDRVAELAKDLRMKFDINSKPGLVRFAMAWHLVPLYRWHMEHGHLNRVWPTEGDEPPIVAPPNADHGAEAG